MVIGRTYTLDELRDRFDAVFISVGAGLPVFLGIPGEGFKGVYSANEYLTRVNLMQAYAFPDADTPVLPGDRVVVVGGGNVALDAVRTAVASAPKTRRSSTAGIATRCRPASRGAPRRGGGGPFEFQVCPLAMEGTPTAGSPGCVASTPSSASLMLRPASTSAVEGSERVIPCDTVVVAVGTRANPLLTSSSPDLALTVRATSRPTTRA